MKITKLWLTIFCLAGILIGAGAVSAVTYVLTTSNSVPIIVTSGTVNVPVTLTTNSTITSITDLDGITLIANAGAKGAGLNVTFYDNSTINLGSRVLDASGQTQIILHNLSIGTHSYTAGP